MEEFGRSVAGIGDFDDNGVNDLIVGSPGLYNSNGNFAGGAYLLLLSESGPVDQATLIESPQGGSAFGTSVVAIGDVDGDGVVDVAISAPQDSDAGTLTGAVYLHFLQSGPGVKSYQKLLPDSDARFFGSSLARFGDMSDDGVVYLFVGQTMMQTDSGLDKTGMVWLLTLTSDGSEPTRVLLQPTTWTGPPQVPVSGDYFGSSISVLSCAVAISCTIAVGAERAENGKGAVHVLNFAVSNGSIMHRALIEPPSTPDSSSQERFGSSVSWESDIDGNGVNDLVVGAQFWTSNTGNGQEGRVYVLFNLNSALSEPEYTRIAVLNGNVYASSMWYFGLGVCVLSGGPNGDAIVVGAPHNNQGNQMWGEVHLLPFSIFSSTEGRRAEEAAMEDPRAWWKRLEEDCAGSYRQRRPPGAWGGSALASVALSGALATLPAPPNASAASEAALRSACDAFGGCSRGEARTVFDVDAAAHPTNASLRDDQKTAVKAASAMVEPVVALATTEMLLCASPDLCGSVCELCRSAIRGRASAEEVLRAVEEALVVRGSASVDTVRCVADVGCVEAAAAHAAGRLGAASFPATQRLRDAVAANADSLPACARPWPPSSRGGRPTRRTTSPPCATRTTACSVATPRRPVASRPRRCGAKRKSRGGAWETARRMRRAAPWRGSSAGRRGRPARRSSARTRRRRCRRTRRRRRRGCCCWGRGWTETRPCADCAAPTRRMPCRVHFGTAGSRIRRLRAAGLAAAAHGGAFGPRRGGTSRRTSGGPAAGGTPTGRSAAARTTASCTSAALPGSASPRRLAASTKGTTPRRATSPSPPRSASTCSDRSLHADPLCREEGAAGRFGPAECVGRSALHHLSRKYGLDPESMRRALDKAGMSMGEGVAGFMRFAGLFKEGSGGPQPSGRQVSAPRPPPPRSEAARGPPARQAARRRGRRRGGAGGAGRAPGPAAVAVREMQTQLQDSVEAARTGMLGVERAAVRAAASRGPAVPPRRRAGGLLPRRPAERGGARSIVRLLLRAGRARLPRLPLRRPRKRDGGPPRPVRPAGRGRGRADGAAADGAAATARGPPRRRERPLRPPRRCLRRPATRRLRRARRAAPARWSSFPSGTPSPGFTT